MEPIDFEESNVVFAKDQTEYLPLPAHQRFLDTSGKVTSCWRLSWRERFKVLVTGRLWAVVLTFNQPLQPQRFGVDNPFKERE